MFIGHIEITGGPKVIKKQMNRLVREAMEACAMHWHESFRPIHFTREGFSRYHYHKRSEKYLRRKIREKGHADPLVFSGKTREQAKKMYLRTSARRATGELPVPKYITQFHGGKHAYELTKILKKEEKVIARLAADNVAGAINNLQERETIKF